jgi:hypothetical protein
LCHIDFKGNEAGVRLYKQPMDAQAAGGCTRAKTAAVSAGQESAAFHLVYLVLSKESLVT